MLPQVDSTNLEAARIVGGLSRPTWILGLQQTAGKGRRGRPWADPIGNFAATLVLFPNGTPDQWALRSFVASLALYRSFTELTQAAPAFALKWPNDILLNGGKVSGILLETLARKNGPPALAIGIGVNLLHAPSAHEVEQGAVAPVSVLSETGVRIQPEAFLKTLSRHFAELEDSFITYGFHAVRDAWLAHAARLGETITARTARGETTGLFDTIDENGHLVLQTAEGRMTISAGDVFF